MRIKIKNIEPQIGLGGLQFGMRQDDVKHLIGLPNEIEIYEYSFPIPPHLIKMGDTRECIRT